MNKTTLEKQSGYYVSCIEQMPNPVYLEDIADAFEACMDEWSQFLNTKTGEIVSVPDDPGLTYYIRLPDQYELHEKRIMEEFTQTCVRGNVANRLWRALNGRHPYRYFKDAITETGVAQKYYDFRALTFLRMAEEWYREHKVRYFRK